MTPLKFTTLCCAVGCLALSACSGAGGSSAAPLPLTTPQTAAPAPAATTPPTPKLIEFGWDMPSMAWLRDHPQVLQQTPFDGVVLDLQSDATGLTDQQQLSWQVWGEPAIDVRAYGQALAAFDAITFPSPMENFLRLNVTPGTVDWFDTHAFSAVLANAGLVARLAHRPGFVGIFLDVETYVFPLFYYPAQPSRRQHSWTEYQAQVSSRGQQFMQALTDAYPDITILLSFGYGWPTGDLRTSPYGLLPAFLDGMLDAATPGVSLYDGYEQAYAYTTDQQFEAAALSMHTQAHAQYHASFGVYDLPHPTPADLGNAVRLGMQWTDRYVWAYSERLNWWNNAIDHRYIDAVEAAKIR